MTLNILLSSNFTATSRCIILLNKSLMHNPSDYFQFFSIINRIAMSIAIQVPFFTHSVGNGILLLFFLFWLISFIFLEHVWVHSKIQRKAQFPFSLSLHMHSAPYCQHSIPQWCINNSWTYTDSSLLFKVHSFILMFSLRPPFLYQNISSLG